MGFSRQECWSGSPFSSSGDRLDPGIEPGSPALQADSLGFHRSEQFTWKQVFYKVLSDGTEVVSLFTAQVCYICPCLLVSCVYACAILLQAFKRTFRNKMSVAFLIQSTFLCKFHVYIIFLLLTPCSRLATKNLASIHDHTLYRLSPWHISPLVTIILFSVSTYWFGLVC